VASVNRLVKSEFEQRLHALALRAAGPYAALGNRAADAVDGGRWTYGYLMSRATTIGAGTAEIQRNTIAETVLGLPSHRGEGTRRAAVTPGAPLVLSDASEIELREVLAKALQSRVDVEARLNPKYSSNGADSAVWSALTEFGLPGLAVDESLGGADAPPRLLYAAIEEAAKALAPVPLVQRSSRSMLPSRLAPPRWPSALCRAQLPPSPCPWMTTGGSRAGSSFRSGTDHGSPVSCPLSPVRRPPRFCSYWPAKTMARVQCSSRWTLATTR